jgi:hypothetical protein
MRFPSHRRSRAAQAYGQLFATLQRYKMLSHPGPAYATARANPNIQNKEKRAAGSYHFGLEDWMPWADTGRFPTCMCATGRTPLACCAR